MFWCWHVVLLKNSCLSLLSISSFSKLSALFDLPGLWQSHNKETCNMNQWYISVSQGMQVMEITVIGYYWTSGSLGLEKRSSYQFHCSKKSPFFVPLKPLTAMAVTFGPQFWDHPHGVRETVWSIGIILRLQLLLVLVRTRSPAGSQTIITAMHFRSNQASFIQDATALIFARVVQASDEVCCCYAVFRIAGRRLRHCIFGSQQRQTVCSAVHVKVGRLFPCWGV